MEQIILTPTQTFLLKLFFQEKSIQENFYLSGGTALAEYYLHHRLSEDLDLFSEKEVEQIAIFAYLKDLQKKGYIDAIDPQQSFNRNLFFLRTKDEVIKTEFTYFPFPQIEKPKKFGEVCVDSLLDIAVNKTFTIYQKPRNRDFIDLFLILRQENYNFTDLLKKARVKFDTPIDPLQLSQNILQVTELKDYPKMIVPLRQKDVETYWLDQVKSLEKTTLKE